MKRTTLQSMFSGLFFLFFLLSDAGVDTLQNGLHNYNGSDDTYIADYFPNYSFDGNTYIEVLYEQCTH